MELLKTEMRLHEKYRRCTGEEGRKVNSRLRESAGCES